MSRHATQLSEGAYMADQDAGDGAAATVGPQAASGEAAPLRRPDRPGRPGRRVLSVTSGGGGAVAPYTGLGVRLRDAGFDVAIATHEPFAGVVRASGLGFHPLPGDPRAWAQSQGSGSGSGSGDGEGEAGAAVLGKIQDAHRETGAAIVAAARAGTDLMLLGALAVPLGYQVAEAVGVPSMGVHLQPTEPTRDFPSVFVPGSLGGWGNRASHKVAGTLFDVWLAGGVKQLRADLGLAPQSLRAMQKRMRREPEDYQRNLPPHVRAARMLGRPVRSIRYVWTTRGPEPLEKQASPIDHHHYLDKQLAPAADALLSSLGTSFEAPSPNWFRTVGTRCRGGHSAPG